MKTAQDIKKVADNLFIVLIIASIVMGVVCAITCGITNEDLVAVGIIGGIFEITFGVFIAWALKTLIRGFGELVENSAVIRENTAPAKAPEAPKATAPITPAAQADPIHAPDSQQDQPIQPETEDAVRPIAVGQDSIKCPRCGAVQRKGRRKCWDCGLPFAAEKDD